MPRNRRKLKYGVARGIRLRKSYDDKLVDIAKRHHMFPSELVRIIIERSLRRRLAKDVMAKLQEKQDRYNRTRLNVEAENAAQDKPIPGSPGSH